MWASEQGWPIPALRRSQSRREAAVAMATAGARSPWMLEVEGRWLLIHRGRKLGLLGRVSGPRAVAAPARLGSSGASLLRDKALFRLDFFSWDFFLGGGGGVGFRGATSG